MRKTLLWTAWLVSVAAEWASHRGLREQLDSGREQEERREAEGGTDDEKETTKFLFQIHDAELNRRRGLIVMNALLRSPFYDLVTSRPVEKLSALWHKVPVLNMLNVVDMLLVLRPYYFYTSGT